MTRKSIGRGKLILFGEHAAVYGHPAVGTSLPCRTELSWEPGVWTSDQQASNEKGRDREVFLALLESARVTVPDNGLTEAGVWHCNGDVPRVGGFGSSAALCVAISRIVLNRLSDTYNRDVHLLANRLEKRFHGTPSGIDTGMSADNGPAAWMKSKNGLPERYPIEIPELNIIYGALHRSGSTADSVGRLRRLIESGNSTTTSAMDQLGDIATGFINAAADGETFGHQGDFPGLVADLVNRAQGILASLDLSTSNLEVLLNLAGKTGAIGGKLSGGGLGGAFYLCASDRLSRDRILDALPEQLTRKGIELLVPLTPLDFGVIHEPESLPRKPHGRR